MCFFAQDIPFYDFFVIYVITRKVLYGTFCPLQPNTIGEGPTNNWSKQRELNLSGWRFNYSSGGGFTEQKNTVAWKTQRFHRFWRGQAGSLSSRQGQSYLFCLKYIFSPFLNFASSSEWKLYSKHIYWRSLAGLSSEALFGCLSDSGISHQVQQQLCPWDLEGKLQKMTLGRCRVGHWASQRFKDTAIESGLERPARCHLILGKVTRGKIFANVQITGFGNGVSHPPRLCWWFVAVVAKRWWPRWWPRW